MYYYYNDQWQILAEYISETTCRQWFSYGNYIDDVLSASNPPDLVFAMRYYTHDHLYSSAAMTNSTGDVVERYEYDAYGKLTIWDGGFSVMRSASIPNNPFTFTGRQLDILDGGVLHNMHYRHRDYNPALGRFLQHDPLGITPKIKFRMPWTQYKDSLNIYEYVKSRPMKLVDAYGLFFMVPPPPPQSCKKNPCPLGERLTCVLAFGAAPCLNAEIARLKTQEVLNSFPGTLPPGRIDGPQDALRHCIGTCLLTQATDPITAAMIASLHEVCSPNSSNGDMDNANNTTGISIGKDPNADCGESCKDALDNGELVVMSPDQWR